MVVFLYLEGTAARFNNDANGIKARKGSADRSEAYIKGTAPGRCLAQKDKASPTKANLIKEKYWPLLVPNFEIGCKVSSSVFHM